MNGSAITVVASAIVLFIASACAQREVDERNAAPAHPTVMPQTEAPPPGNPAGAMPASAESALGSPMPHATNVADRIFMGQAALAGLAEVAHGEQVAGRTGEAVASFAQQMIRDHRTANQRLTALAQAAGIPLPTALDPTDEAERRRLQGLSGRAAEIAYIDGQVVAHQKATQLLQWELASGQDPTLRQFAADQLPIIMMHLEIARTLQAQLRQHPTASR